MEDQVRALLRENDALKRQLAELEGRLVRSVGSSGSDVGEPQSPLEGVFREAERNAYVVGAWVWDTATHRIAWSEQLYRLLGYDPRHDEPSLDAYFAAVHPEDRDELRRQSARWAEGDTETVTFRVLLRDGSLRHVLASASATRDAPGAPVRVLGTCLDVTGMRRTSEELGRAYVALAEAQRTAHIGSWRFIVATETLEWSEEFRRLLGVDPDAHPSAELFFAHVHPEDRERFERLHALALEGQTARGDARVLRRDGSTAHVHVVGTPVFDASNKVVAINGTMLDVTERVELDEQLLRARKLEALGTLAGGVAHDFNNLLTVILGNLDLLRTHVSEGGVDYLNGIEQAAELAGRLTSELLAFGRKAPLEQRVVDLNALLPDALNIAQRLVGEKVQIITRLDHGLWPVSVDKGQLHQIVLNLVVNARDAMPGGGEIAVRTRNCHVRADATRKLFATPGDYVVMEVQDQGVGFDEATRARLFEPFFSTKHASRGAGLGLAVVFGAVSEHGGAIDVDSSPGRGATFRVYFPRATATLASTNDGRGVETTVQMTPAKVLVVEDDPAVARMLADTLLSGGYDVSVAHRASEAINCWRNARGAFDLVICDFVMPDLRGSELMRALAAQYELKRAMFITGYGPELFGQGAHERAHPVLLKPFSAAQLLQKVAEVLAR